jgi:hypothetical protein
MTNLRYSDGIAAARTMIALQGNASALQHRLPTGWELAPYAGDDLRGSSLRDANMLVPFYEVYAVRTHDGQLAGLPQVSYIAFVSPGCLPRRWGAGLPRPLAPSGPRMKEASRTP